MLTLRHPIAELPNDKLVSYCFVMAGKAGKGGPSGALVLDEQNRVKLFGSLILGVFDSTTYITPGWIPVRGLFDHGPVLREAFSEAGRPCREFWPCQLDRSGPDSMKATTARAICGQPDGAAKPRILKPCPSPMPEPLALPA